MTTGITAPKHAAFTSGLSTAFSLGAAHKLAKGAVLQDVAAFHVSVGHLGVAPSVSTQIAALRRLLLAPHKGVVGSWLQHVSRVRLCSLSSLVSDADGGGIGVCRARWW